MTNVHTYTIDWQPDSISWAIDGTILRTKFRNETYNTTSGQYHFPQSPSRVQLSLWPAGLQQNGQGTVNWAGGLVDWSSQYMQNGYYYAMVSDVSVECYDPPSGTQKSGSKAYYYTTTAGTNDTVAIGDNSTILASFYATGDDPSTDPNAVAKASGTKTASSSASATATPQTVPGVSGGGNVGISGSAPGQDSSSSSSSSSGGGSVSAGSSGDAGGSSSFSQGDMGGTSQAPPRMKAGSALALIGFFVGCMLL